ncbi:hypothetical protein FB567DRAFT_607260 [Paraphoma chrysanthemicola]|uniref:Uncharacterized protein n=1 Tax=Paraphoma chrysanthemicola TaxID=798071 RepID=A0A8K0R052_9PLEO|nr:hypothetical protein FB567DRAFT_607260 [Paraphoma chrysanthemicola]
MLPSQVLLFLGLVVTSAMASPLEVESRQAVVICDDLRFTPEQINLCEDRACFYWATGDQIISDNGRPYPTTFNNSPEGFVLRNLRGPFVEFPLGPTVYNGGQPGRARCIIEAGSCNTAAQIVHPRGGGNLFATCTGSS